MQRAEAALGREVAARNAAAQAWLSHFPSAQREHAQHAQAELAAAQDALAAARGRCATHTAEAQAARKEAGRLRKVLDCSALEAQVVQAEKVLEGSDAAVEEAKVVDYYCCRDWKCCVFTVLFHF